MTTTLQEIERQVAQLSAADKAQLLERVAREVGGVFPGIESTHANENFALPVVEELRRLGHDVVTIAETGKATHVCTRRCAGRADFQSQALLTAASRTAGALWYHRMHFRP